MTRREALAVVVLATLVGGCQNAEPLTPDDAPARALELAPGESVAVVVATHCGYEWLELTVNDQLWRTAELDVDQVGNVTEPAWPQGVPSAELELHLVDEGTLEVTAAGSTVSHTYAPATGSSGCE